MKVKLPLAQRVAWWIGSAIVEVQEFIDTVDMVKKGRAAIEIEDGFIVPEPNAKWYIEQGLMVVADTCKVADKEHRPLTENEMKCALLYMRHAVKDLEQRLGSESSEQLDSNAAAS